MIGPEKLIASFALVGLLASSNIALADRTPVERASLRLSLEIDLLEGRLVATAGLGNDGGRGSVGTLASELARVDRDLRRMEGRSGPRIGIARGGEANESRTLRPRLDRVERQLERRRERFAGGESLTSGMGTVTGTVTTSEGGVPLQGVVVNLLNAESGELLGYAAGTGADGVFVIQGVPPGTWSAATINESGLVDEAYGGVSCMSLSCSPGTLTAFAVVADQTAGGVDFALAPGARVSGRVTSSASGQGLEGAFVLLYDGNGLFLREIFTDVDGAWITPSGLTTGSYKFRTYSALDFVDEIFDDVACLACDPRTTGSAVQVSSPETVSNLDFSLDAGGKIGGTIRDAAGGAGLPGYVAIFDAAGTEVSGAYADAAGNFLAQAHGLPSGTYRAIAYANDFDYVPELWNQQTCFAGCDSLAGVAIPVTVGSTSGGIDFRLGRGGWVVGAVQRAGTLSAIENAVVMVYTDTGRFVGAATSSKAGWGFGGLISGNYRANTYNEYGYVDELYSEQPCAGGMCDVSAGTTFSVVRGATTSNVVFTLAPGGKITGARNVETTVSVFDASGGLVTQDDGLPGIWETFTGLPSGTYFVKSEPVAAGLAPLLYDAIECTGSCDPTAGTAVVVSESATTSGIDFDHQPPIAFFADGFESGSCSGWSVGAC